MNKILYCLCIALVLISCDKESADRVSRNVVSTSDDIAFEEILLLLNIQTENEKYLVVESINSIRLYINDFYWNTATSMPLDISNIDKEQVDDRYVTDDKVNYLVISDREDNFPDFTTAGEISQYLNSIYDLAPGEYVCFIESFKINFLDGSVQTFYPYEYTAFKIDKNSRSAFVGEITLKID